MSFVLFVNSDQLRFEANLSLPIQFDVNYQLYSKIKTGLNFDGLGSSYNINKHNILIMNILKKVKINCLLIYNFNLKIFNCKNKTGLCN